MRVVAVLIVLLFTTTLYASENGATIKVPGYACTVQNDDQIICTDTGKTCDAIRARQKAYEDRIFGCIDPISKNYPCPPWENYNSLEWRWRLNLESTCRSHGFQSLHCNAEFSNCDWWHHGKNNE